jgi:outer membrane lipoprotein-sorting protein
LHKQKFLGFILMIILAVALNGCNQSGTNKSRPAPTRPKSHMNQSKNKSVKQEKSKTESQGKQGKESGKSQK